MARRHVEQHPTDSSSPGRVLWLTLAAIFAVAMGLNLYLAADAQVGWPIVAAALCCAGAVLSGWQGVRRPR